MVHPKASNMIKWVYKTGEPASQPSTCLLPNPQRRIRQMLCKSYNYIQKTFAKITPPSGYHVPALGRCSYCSSSKCS